MGEPRKKKARVKQFDEMTPEERRVWNRETVEIRGYTGRLWVHGLTATYMDVHRKPAADMYRRDTDGCATLWRWHYRQRHGLPTGPEPKRSGDPDLVTPMLGRVRPAD